MHVPASVPVAPGQPIRLNIGIDGRPEVAGLGDGPLDATIVRVDRHKMLSLGHLPVGIRFVRPQA